MNTDTNPPNTGGFLSGERLVKKIQNEEIIQNDNEDIDISNTDWNYDLSLGEEVYLSSEDEIRILESRESVAIKPGEFALLITEEKVKVPEYLVAFISLRFSIKIQGLINVSGFHVDPSYEGKLIFSVYNAGPSPTFLRRGDDIFMIVFANLTNSIGEGRDDANFDGVDGLQPKWVTGLQGRTASLEKLDESLDKIDQRVNLHSAIITGLVVALIVFLFGQVAGI